MRIINLLHDTLFWFRVDSEMPGHIWHSMPWAAASYRKAQSRELDSTPMLKQVQINVVTYHIVIHLVCSIFPQQPSFASICFARPWRPRFCASVCKAVLWHGHEHLQMPLWP